MLEFLKEMGARLPPTAYQAGGSCRDELAVDPEEGGDNDGYRVGGGRMHQSGSRRPNGGGPPPSNLSDGEEQN